MRKYFYSIKETTHKDDNKQLSHLYIYAKPKFSQRELFAKQDNVLLNALELPFNNITIKCGSLREIEQVKFKIHPNVTTFQYSFLKLDKITQEVIISYDYVMEFVFENCKHIKPFLHWLKKKWKGKASRVKWIRET